MDSLAKAGLRCSGVRLERNWWRDAVVIHHGGNFFGSWCSDLGEVSVDEDRH
ncbi:hypothetical protein D9M70_626080 [compost metagenome]